MMRALARSRLVLLILALLLGSVLAFPQLFIAYLLAPVAAMLWAGWRVIASVDQRVYWLLLSVLCVLLTLREFASRGKDEPLPSHGHSPKRLTRVQRWHGLFQAAGRSHKGEAALQASLRTLLASIIAQPGEPPAPDLYAALKARRIFLPAGVQDYLGPGKKGASRSLLSGIGYRIRGWFGGKTARNDASINEALRWMEEMMEISHDQ